MKDEKTIHIETFGNDRIKMPLTPVPMSLLESFTPSEAIAKLVLLINCLIEHLGEVDTILNNLDELIKESASQYAKEYIEEYKVEVDGKIQGIKDELDESVDRLDTQIRSTEIRVNNKIDTEINKLKQELRVYSPFYETTVSMKEAVEKLQAMHQRGYTWDERDAWNYTFTKYDNANLTWNYYDSKNYTFESGV